ncbi:hypothetical protein [Hymenobacter sp. B81]|uniref:hypothetical protein n=1 Tax=Hymenobacter sp. B81 TaxID=3344878 RepID=UPI0037DDBA51
MTAFPAVLTDRVNAALAQHLGLWLSEEKCAAIQGSYGFETSLLVKQVYETAVSVTVDWSTQTMIEAVANVRHTLQHAYPWLEESSIQRLTSCFAYAWK